MITLTGTRYPHSVRTQQQHPSAISERRWHVSGDAWYNETSASITTAAPWLLLLLFLNRNCCYIVVTRAAILTPN